MRIDGFLRTPIRADHQNRMENLTISETGLKGNPVAAPYPQSLQISFTPVIGVSEVQISPLWEGSLGFIADDISQLPTDPAQISESNYPNWSVNGDLLLCTWHGLKEAFDQHFHIFTSLHTFDEHIDIFTPLPATVRYSKVTITHDFLFTTIRRLTRLSFIYAGHRITQSDPEWFEKFVVQFLQGRAFVPCLHDVNDAAQDFALNPMPSVKLDSTGAVTSLYVTAASLTQDVLDPKWFVENPAYDGNSGEVLVDPVLATLQNQFYNPLHPSHSVIPLNLIYQDADNGAYAADQSASPLRAALSAARTDGKNYRRIDLIRFPIPDDNGTTPQPRIPPIPAEFSSFPHRPYPTFQLCWRPAAGGTTESLRIPLSGRLYLPLLDTDYHFWAIPRSDDPLVNLAGDLLLLSPNGRSQKYIPIPTPALDLAIGTKRTCTIYANLTDFDSQFVFENFKTVKPTRKKFRNKAHKDWNVEVLDWFIPTDKWDFAPLYGFIRESAERHNLSPEFLHTIFFGEGANLQINNQPAYTPNFEIGAFGFLGLDLILYRLGKIPHADPPYPPYPPEITDSTSPETEEYKYNLQTNGYVDTFFADNVVYFGEFTRNEGGNLRTLQLANIIGWRTAVELVAAELHQRLDEMIDYCTQQGISLAHPKSREYLAYVRFVASLATAKKQADHLSNNLRRWEGNPPTKLDARYATLQRIAVAQWYSDAQIYGYWRQYVNG